jgi:hypothetical protein
MRIAYLDGYRWFSLIVFPTSELYEKISYSNKIVYSCKYNRFSTCICPNCVPASKHIHTPTQGYDTWPTWMKNAVGSSK